ncbi:hypothetical protein [Mycolicibacterium sp. XJ1819]
MPDRSPGENIAEWDAAYVLGALSAEDRRAYETYLAENPERAADLAEVSAMPDILDVLSREEAMALIETDEPGVASLAEAASRRQRRSRRAMLLSAVAAAAALAVVGGVVGATVFPRSEPAPTVAMAPMQPGEREGLTAQLAVTEKAWGTQLNWACEYTRDWARSVEGYDIVVTTRDGTQTTVGSWAPAGDEATGMSAATSIPTAEIQTVDIRVSGTDQPLATTTLV